MGFEAAKKSENLKGTPRGQATSNESLTPLDWVTL
jgi:hypothetical protein